MSKEYQFRKIPTHRIRPNPKNPRKVYQPGLIEAMEASLRALGQLTAMKVRNLSEAERAQDPDHDVEVMGGDIRLAGGLRAGLPTMDCQVYMNLTPDEAELIGDMDNKDHNMVWLAWYEAIERRLAKPDQPSQDQVGKEMEASQQLVSQAAKTLKYLNPASRAMIYHSVVKPDGDYEVSPKMVLKLADLADSQKIESALKVAIRLKMTVADAKKLAEWVQAGNPAETYTRQKAPKQPKAKKAPPSAEVLAKAAELGRQQGLAEGRGEDPKPAQDQLNAYLAEIKTQTLPVVTPPSFKITSPAGFALLKQAVNDGVGKLIQKVRSTEPATGNEAAQQVKTSNSKSLKWFEKAARGFVKIVWHGFIKNEHKVCKKLAHAIVPLSPVPLSNRHTQTLGLGSEPSPRGQSSSHSSGTHSAHSRNRSNSLSQGLMTLSLTILHGVVYTLLQFVFLWSVAMWFTSHWLIWLKPWVEVPFRFTARLALVDFPAWASTWALGHVVPAIIIAVLLFLGYSYAWNNQRTRMTILGLCLFLFVYYGRRWANESGPLSQPVVNEPPVATIPAVTQAVRSSELEVRSLKPKTSNSKLQTANSTPAASYQPSIAFNTTASPSDSSGVLTTLYDPKLLEQEIAALPQNCIVTAYPVLPDEGIPGDLAVTRLQDLMDPDKYTLMIGSGKYKIMNISATATGLMINYQNTDIIDVFNHGGTATYVWEDMLYIHTDEIEQVRSSELESSQLKTSNSSLLTSSPDNVIYHCTVIGAGAKNALTFQCRRADDLKHLVSALEYFIRNSRLGHDTVLAGMPYTLQGLRLTNECVVEKIWTNSPAWNAVSYIETAQPNHVTQLVASQQVPGLQLGDHFWSVGKATKDQQEKKDFEKGLSSTQVPTIFFVASGAEWTKAQIAAGVGNAIHPKLKKVVLIAN